MNANCWARAKVRELMKAITQRLDEQALECSRTAVTCWKAATALRGWR